MKPVDAKAVGWVLSGLTLVVGRQLWGVAQARHSLDLALAGLLSLAGGVFALAQSRGLGASVPVTGLGFGNDGKILRRSWLFFGD